MWETYPGYVPCTVAIVILCLFVMVVMFCRSTVSTPKLCHTRTEIPCHNVKDHVETAVKDVDILIVAQTFSCVDRWFVLVFILAL